MAVDRVLGTLFGYKALELALNGKFNEVVVIQGMRISSVSLESVAGAQRTVPLDHPLIAASRAVGTCFGDQKVDW